MLGSHLVGLDRDRAGQRVKDVDFCVYGLESMRRVRERIGAVRAAPGAGAISPEHVSYQAHKFASLGNALYSDFQATLERKWCSLQLAPGLLTTIRFVYDDDEIPPSPWKGAAADAIELQGEVTGADHACFIPRRFTLLCSDGDPYEVVSPLWAFHCCVRDGDVVRVRGRLHAGTRALSVARRSDGIRITP